QFTQTLITLSFNGSGSVDRGGTITSYAWRFGDGGTASGVSPTHAYATPGTYTATLTITDSRGSSASDTAVVRVVNRSPVANAGSDQSGILGSAVTFRGSGSDQDGTVTSYTWDFGDGASAAGATASHAYATAGTYTAKLTVTDDRGALGSDSALVTVAGSPGGTPWARGFGGAASDVGYGVAVDASGNAVMTGRVESTVDFGGGVVCPPAAVFVSKYSPTGATVWSKCLGGVLGGGTGRAVAVDGSGNVLVTGKFSGTVDFGTGALTSAGPSSIFVAKYSAAGAPVWSRAFGGGLNDVGNGVAVDSGGNVVIIGTASGTVSFGGGPITANGYTVVVAKFSPAGAHLWSRGFGDSFSNSGNGVAVDASGNAVMTGRVESTVDFGGGALISAAVDIFLAKLSPTGGHLWSRHFGSGLATHAGNGVACDGSGNVLVTGSFENSIDLGAGWTTSFAHKDVFVAKYSPAGAYLWSRLAGGLYDDAGRGIAVDRSGKVVVTGTFQAAVNFGTGSLISAGRTDIFVARYSPDGTPLVAQRFGSADFDAGNAVAVDGSGRPVVTGSYRLGGDFGGTALGGAGMDDIFLVGLR
ncbi:MAG: PKD domain-containing protein, partial [Deltaproteobacteria bacterium]